jgi:glycosyltransferase involved in cell wall biosynthesis
MGMDIPMVPKISIVTPSLNQGEYLEDTIKSVFSQGYANLEYIIIDGGSTDGSVEIIKKYADKLAYWQSSPDRGRGDAVNKGFQRSPGEIMAWLGCGDMYCPWALKVVSEIFMQLPQVEWLTTASPIIWDVNKLPISCGFLYGYTRDGFKEGYYLPAIATLQQESTFWRRSLWERAGGYIDEKLPLVPDFELWMRFSRYAEIYTTPVPLGGICRHPSQESFLKKAISVGRNIWLKYYGKDYGKCCTSANKAMSLLRVLHSCLRKYQMKIVDYDFKTGQWQIRQIKGRLFYEIERDGTGDYVLAK